MNKFERFVLLLAVMSVAGCRHPLSIRGEGDIIELRDRIRGCTLEEFQAGDSRCVDNLVADNGYHVTYEAVAREGWRFAAWEGLGCGPGSEGSKCKYDVDAQWTALFNASWPDYAYPASTAVFERIPEPALIKEPLPDATAHAMLYILLSFSDMTVQTTAEEHFARVYEEENNARSYFIENFYGRVELVPAVETNGAANDGIVSVTLDMLHPDSFNTRNSAYDKTAAAAIRAAAGSVSYSSYDANLDGVLDPRELAVVLVYAGGGYSSWESESSDWKRIRPHFGSIQPALDIQGVNIWIAAHVPETTLAAAAGFFYPSRARASLIHELGHLIWGLEDLYDADGSSVPVGPWDVMSYSSAWDTTEYPNVAISPHMGGYSKIASGFGHEQEIAAATSSLSITPLAYSTSPGNKEDDIYRIWLDPYKVRESIVLENRQQLGFDRLLPGEGLLVSRVQSLAEGNANDDYRRMEVVDNGGTQGITMPLTNFELTATMGSPGDTAMDPWGQTTAQVAFARQKDDGTVEVDVDLLIYGPERGHRRHDQNSKEAATTANDRTQDYSVRSEGWSGTTYVNDTSFTKIDGMEVKLTGDSVVTIYIYEGVVDQSPYSLLYSQTYSASVKGWNRFMLNVPHDFPNGNSRFIVVAVQTRGEPAPLLYARPSVVTNSYKSHLSSDGSSFIEVDWAWRNILLLSKPD